MQMGEKRKVKPTTTTGLLEYPSGVILAAGESKDPMDAADNARYYCELHHAPAPLALVLSHEVFR
jgi:hypothetical protein